MLPDEQTERNQGTILASSIFFVNLSECRIDLAYSTTMKFEGVVPTKRSCLKIPCLVGFGPESITIPIKNTLIKNYCRPDIFRALLLFANGQPKFRERAFFANGRKAMTTEDGKYPKNTQNTQKRA